MRKLLAVLALGLVALAAVVAARTLRFEKKTTPVEPAAPLALDEAAALAHLAAAIRVPTVSVAPGVVDAEAMARFHALLAESFPRVHATLERELVADYSLLYRWPGRDPAASPVVLCSHQDVVPVGEESLPSWTHPPFDGVVADGFLWGRGTLDDKVGVFAILEAVEALLGEGFVPARTVYLAFGHDEEALGSGAAVIARTLAERGVQAAVVLDEGMTSTRGIVPGVEPAVALVGIAEKGYATVELTTRSDGGHSSMPPHPTAVGRLGRAVARLDAEPLPWTIEGPLRRFFEAIAPEMGWSGRAAIANLWLTGPLLARRLEAKPSTAAMLRTTTAPTRLEGSPKENVLATVARAWINFRIHPQDSVDGLLAQVRRVVDDPEVEIAVLPGAAEPSPVSPDDGPEFAWVARSIRQVFPDQIVAPTLVLGATDGRHYANVSRAIYRYLPVVLGPDDTARVHGVNERLPVDAYPPAIRFYGQLLRNLDRL